LWIALASRRAWAGELGSSLLLTVAAPAEESARLVTVARELLQPLDVQVELRRVPHIDVAELRRPSAQSYFARVWIALSPTGSARLYLEHGASDRLLVRDVPGNASNPELLREELGHILQAAVEGLKAGEEVGEPRQEVLQQVAPEQPRFSVGAREPPAPPPIAPERRSRLRAGLRYEARWLGDGARFEDGPGVAVAWAAPLGAELGVYYRRPLRVEVEPVGARLETFSARALVSLEVSRGLRLGAGLGADFVRVTPIDGREQSSELTEPGSRQLALGRLQATYGHRVARWLELELSAGADLDPSGTRYVFERDAGDLTVLAPSPLRPFLSLGASLP
jgi:hypothetical protein